MKFVTKLRGALVNKHQIVIAGAGYGGVVAAHYLTKNKLPEDRYEVVLINPEPWQDSRSELDLIIDHRTNSDFTRIPLTNIFREKEVRLIYGRMTEIDKDNKEIEVELTKGGERFKLPYSELVIATGAEASYPPVPGLKEHALTFWTTDDAEEFRAKLEERFSEASQTDQDSVREELLTITVVGAGASGVEAVGPLVESVKSLASQMNINPDEITINLVDGIDHVLMDLPDNMRKQADEYLKSLGVNLYLGSFVDRVEEDQLTLKSGQKIPYGLLMFAGGAKPSKQTNSWGFERDRFNRIITTADLLVDGEVNIWALGDVAAVKGEGVDSYPMLAQHAMRQGSLVAKNILKKLSGDPKLEDYDGKSHGQFVSIGNNFALGWALKDSIQLDGKLGSLMKHMIYAMYWNEAGGPRLVLDRLKKLRRIRK